MIKTYTQGLALDSELYTSVGKWALDAKAHEQIGMPVTGQDEDIWLVSIKNDRPVGFAQLRPMKNRHFHLRYLHSDNLAVKLELGRAACNKAQEMEAQCVYTNERTDSPIMPDLGFVKVREHAKSKFARWERRSA